MTQKRDYEKPAMKVVEVKIESHLLNSSPVVGTNTTIQWGDGGTDTGEVYF